MTNRQGDWRLGWVLQALLMVGMILLPGVCLGQDTGSSSSTEAVEAEGDPPADDGEAAGGQSEGGDEGESEPTGDGEEAEEEGTEEKGEGTGGNSGSEIKVETVRAGIPQGFQPDDLQNTSACKFEATPEPGTYQHGCQPTAIEVSPTRASTVSIELPPGVTKLQVTAGERWSISRLNMDEVTFDDDCKAPDEIHLQLYKQRLFNPPYADGKLSKNVEEVTQASSAGEDGSEMDRAPGMFKPVRRADFFLRGEGNCPSTLSLLLSGDQTVLRVTRWVRQRVEDDGDGETRVVEKSYTDQINLRYYNWLVDVGGFYGIRRTGDEELVTRVVGGTDGEAAMTEVLRIDKPDTSASSGLMMTFFRRSYPRMGISFGLAVPDGRAQSYFLGGSWRFLNLGPRAVATLSGGAVISEVLTYPGIEAEAMYDANDPRLNGTVDYTTKPFVAITLGFELPIGGAK